MTIDPKAPAASDLAGLYPDLHMHPELSFQERRTAAIVADQLRGLGYQTTTGVGRTGVVGILRNGEGRTALLRADMDGLPVAEQTGLAYASVARGVDRDGHEGPVMHACGHDMHVSCLIGACRELADNRRAWPGTLIVVWQAYPDQFRQLMINAMRADYSWARPGQDYLNIYEHIRHK